MAGDAPASAEKPTNPDPMKLAKDIRNNMRELNKNSDDSHAREALHRDAQLLDYRKTSSDGMNMTPLQTEVQTDLKTLGFPNIEISSTGFMLGSYEGTDGYGGKSTRLITASPDQPTHVEDQDYFGVHNKDSN